MREVVEDESEVFDAQEIMCPLRFGTGETNFRGWSDVNELDTTTNNPLTTTADHGVEKGEGLRVENLLNTVSTGSVSSFSINSSALQSFSRVYLQSLPLHTTCDLRFDHSDNCTRCWSWTICLLPGPATLLVSCNLPIVEQPWPTGCCNLKEIHGLENAIIKSARRIYHYFPPPFPFSV